MLLRNPAPQDRGPDIFLTMTSHTPTPDDHHHQNNNNSLSDIWDDEATTFQSHPHQPYPYHPHPHHQHQHQQPPASAVVSDVPRLAHAHRTAGYRDGVTAAKARTAQAGFDEGYGLGATIGARAGQLLGVLEGLAAALALAHLRDDDRRAGGGSEARRLEALLAEARRELGLRGVFDGQHWAGDGTWRYQVGSGAGSGGMEGLGGEMGMLVFADVAEAHPLLRKWGGIVRAEAARYGVDWEVLKDEAGEVRGDEEDEQEREGRARREKESRPAARGREALAW